MLDFELPLVNGSLNVKDAFEPMIRRGVSGIIVSSGQSHRLLHFTQVRGAWEAGVRTVSEIDGYVNLDQTQLTPGGVQPLQGPDYLLEKRAASAGVVRSRREFGAAVYLAPSPGYTCTAQKTHCYPPLRRGLSDSCIVLGCKGKLP